MHHPTFFVGLGGSGVKTLAHLKRLLHRSFPPEEIAQHYRFLFVDADDTAEWEKLRNDFKPEFDRDKDFVDRDHEWYSIGNLNPQERWQFARQNQADSFAADVLRWVDPETAANHFPPHLVRDGAGARRQLGRFCLAFHYDSVYRKLRDGYKALNDVRTAETVAEHVQTWVVASSCGGTGSSTLYDVLYLLSVVGNEIVQGDPIVRPVIYAPQPFFDQNPQNKELQQRYQANACAFFLELQHAFAARVKGKFNAIDESARPSAHYVQGFRNNTWLPFKGALLVDFQRESPPDFLPFAALHQTVAELVYYLVLSGAEASFKALWENDNKNEANGSTGTFPRYMTAGFGAVEYPANLLRRYTEARFARDFTQGRFRDVPQVSQKVVASTVTHLLETSVLGKLRQFADTARQEHLDHVAKRAASTSDFYALGSQDVDAERLTASKLEASLRELDDKVGDMVRAVRADFANRFGQPDSSDPSCHYGAIREELQRLMEAQIEGKGVYSWTGPSGRPEDGLAVRLMSALRDARLAAAARLDDSNAKVAKIEGKKTAQAEGLEQIKGHIVGRVSRGRGLMGFLKGDSDLRALLEAFAAKRAARVNEAFDNVVTMLEIELLSYVGMEGPRVVRADYFVSQAEGPSCLQALKDQGHRIELWLGRLALEAESAVESAEQLVQAESQSMLTTYVPSLEDIVLAGDRQPGRESSRALERLFNLSKEHLKEALLELTARDGRAGVNWRAVCATERNDSSSLLERYLDGLRAWIDAQVAADEGLREALRGSLKAYLAKSPGPREQVAERLGLRRVKALGNLSAGAIKEREKYRLLVTAEPPAPDSLATWLGFKERDTEQAHFVDPTAPERALAVKTYNMLVLETDFPWFSKLRYAYDSNLSFEPHIRRGGRVWYQLNQSEARSQRAFAVSVAWAVVLMGNRAREFEHLAALFTTRLANEYESYVHEGPLALRNRAFFLLTTPLTDEAYTSDGRLEFPCADGLYEKVAGPGEYGRVWNEFLKRPAALGSAEVFHRWSAGVEHTWTAGDEPTVALAPNGRQRAEAFRNKLPEVIAMVKERLETLRGQRRRSLEDEDSLKVLGWVANELERERDDIASQALDADGL